jgi:hypothetical protein
MRLVIPTKEGTDRFAINIIFKVTKLSSLLRRDDKSILISKISGQNQYEINQNKN